MSGSNLTAYILAGGDSRRMGVDKLFLPVGGQSLLEHTVAVCEACFRQVKLVAGQAAKFSSLRLPVVIDSSGARGPMAGVIAALEDCHSDYCFVTAADLVDLSAEVIVSLINQYGNQQYIGVTEAGGVQPLCGIYHKSSLDIFHRFARQGNFRMIDAVLELNHSGIPLPSRRWRNVNNPEDLPVGELDA